LHADIAVVTLDRALDMTASNVGMAFLPPDNNEQFVGVTCRLVGWGRTGSSNVLPNILQTVSIPVISTGEASSRVKSGVAGADVCDDQIAVYDSAESKGACNGDGGGALLCSLNGMEVLAGIGSWGVSGGGACLPSYPSVYTRIGAYRDWILFH
jgi:secreted trypsin-like serine protease